VITILKDVLIFMAAGMLLLRTATLLLRARALPVAAEGRRAGPQPAAS
jgi:hypothetical protein